MEILAVVLVLGFVGYMAVREERVIDITPKINKRHIPRASYLKSVREDTELKNKVGEIIAADKERVKKKFI